MNEAKRIEIKGYVKYYQELVPITWEWETKKFARDVKRVRLVDNQLCVDERLFDDKVNKDEIMLDASLFIDKTSNI